jgi:hypothetical protein
VRLGQRQLGGRLLQASLVQLSRRVSQRQVRMIDRRALRKRPQHRVDRSGLPVEHPPERVICDQPSSRGPIAGREGVAHGLHDFPAVSEPPRGAAVEV